VIIAAAGDPPNGAEPLVRLPEGHGVKVVFGRCGDMADVAARMSGKVGVGAGPWGGGASYLLAAVVEASESAIALAALTTDIATAERGRYPLTELDRKARFRPVTVPKSRPRSVGACLGRAERRLAGETRARHRPRTIRFLILSCAGVGRRPGRGDRASARCERREGDEVACAIGRLRASRRGRSAQRTPTWRRSAPNAVPISGMRCQTCGVGSQ